MPDDFMPPRHISATDRDDVLKEVSYQIYSTWCAKVDPIFIIDMILKMRADKTKPEWWGGD